MTGKNQQIICSILIFWTVIVMNLGEKLPWGSPCETDLECRDGEISTNFEDGKPFISPMFGHDVDSKCKDSRCKCRQIIQILEFKDNNYVCLRPFGKDIHTCIIKDPDTCVNGVCEDGYPPKCKCNDGFVHDGNKCRETVTVDYSAYCTTPESDPIPVCNYDLLMRCNSTGKCGCFKDHFYDVENKTCISKEAYIEKYSEETKAGLDEFCGISSDGLPKVCDEIANMTCVSKKCKCTKEFYPSFAINLVENGTCESIAGENGTCESIAEKNGTCESKASYVKENNLKSYKVMPGVYCYDNDDCLTGLTCASNECACPHPCTYDNKTIACDCGAVSSMEGASQAVLVGVIGGIAIIAFWGYMIKKTIEKSPINSKYYDEPTCSEQHTPVPLSEPYRVKSTTTSDYSTAPIPAPNPPYPVSPVCNQEPSSAPPYPVSAPSDPSAPVGFTAPIAPPPDVAQQPPSYSSNPSPYPTNPAPYTSNPIPYPTSPATFPGSSINPAVNTGPGNPISPDARQTTENSTNPSDNTTPYPQNPPSAPAVDIYKPVIS